MKIENPYYEEYEILMSERDSYKSGFYSDVLTYQIRIFLVKKYSWSVLSDENYLEIFEIMKGNIPKNRKKVHMVSMGAGSGYHESIFQSLGVDVLCVDTEDSNFHFLTRYAPIRTDESGVLAEVSEYDVLFLSWPPYNTSFAKDSLELFGGNMVVYIGEGKMGCTGDDEFHEMLDKDFNLAKTICNPTYPGIHDSVYIYTRKPKLWLNWW